MAHLLRHRDKPRARRTAIPGGPFAPSGQLLALAPDDLLSAAPSQGDVGTLPSEPSSVLSWCPGLTQQAPCSLIHPPPSCCYVLFAHNSIKRVYQCPGDAVTNRHTLSGLDSRNTLSHSSKGQEVQDQGVGRAGSPRDLGGRPLLSSLPVSGAWLESLLVQESPRSLPLSSHGAPLGASLHPNPPFHKKTCPGGEGPTLLQLEAHVNFITSARMLSPNKVAF